jgi:uncharacterized protein YjiS (DUF1127 family)
MSGTAILSMTDGGKAMDSRDDGMVRDFLATALRYLLTPREIRSLRRMDEQTMRAIGVTRQEFERLIAGVQIFREVRSGRRLPASPRMVLQNSSR